MRRDKWSPSRRWSSARHSSDSLVHGGGAQRSILPAQATPSTIGLASLPCEFQSWFCATSTLTKTRQCMEASCLLNYVSCLENETVCGTGLGRGFLETTRGGQLLGTLTDRIACVN